MFPMTGVDATRMHTGWVRAATVHPDRAAIRAGDGHSTWRDLDERSTGFAHHLQARGIGRGDRVAVMTSNRVEFVLAVAGISKAGAATVLLSPAWKRREVEHALALTSPVLGVADGEAVALLGDHLGAAAVVDLDDQTAADGVFASSTDPVVVDGEPTDDDESVLVFSSGTTGMPKAVRHTHSSMGHGVVHWRAALGLGPDDRFQVATPPSHILGLLNLLTAADAGATVRLHQRFDLDEVLRRVESDRITLEMAVAPIALAMANHPDIERYDLSSLRYIMWAPHRSARTSPGASPSAPASASSPPTARASCTCSP